jgi:hypothetical protein
MFIKQVDCTFQGVLQGLFEIFFQDVKESFYKRQWSVGIAGEVVTRYGNRYTTCTFKSARKDSLV